MYRNDKHSRKIFKASKKSISLLVSALLIFGVLIGGTIAYIADASGSRTNVFQPSSITTTVVEDLDGTAKSNVSIKNTGDTDAWIRVAIVVTWKNSSGNVYNTAPVINEDYTMTLDLANGWELGNDGFYYWKSPVAPDNNTGTLITSCVYNLGKAPQDFFLSVEVIGSGIQSKPSNAFDDNWKASSGLKVSSDGTSLEKIINIPVTPEGGE